MLVFYTSIDMFFILFRRFFLRLRIFEKKITLHAKGITHLRHECHNSKFGIFELLVLKETFTDALLTGIVS